MPGALPDSEALFQPLRVGLVDLQHRVALAPLTRFRANDDHVPSDLQVEYYRQRAGVPGTLLITEATFIAPKAGGYTNVPGIWNDAQVAGWKKVVDAVHANGSFIYVQLWALGRPADALVLADEVPGADVVSSGDIPLGTSGVPDSQKTKPRPLTHAEIDEYVAWYVTAARNAVHGAGFDGVEVHCLNGYLLDQFVQDVTNNRTDEYGGSIENRLRFPLRVVDAVVQAVGPDRTGIRLSPFERANGMHMADPRPTFSALVAALKPRELAYLHLTEPRTASTIIGVLPAPGQENPVGESLDFACALWAPRPIILAGGYTPELARKRAQEGANVVIAFGRYFISNPDLPLRILKEIPLSAYDRSTFYAHKQAAGYTDYSTFKA